MESKKDIQLMDNAYLPGDARNLLFGLMNGKMNFHNLELMKALECSDGTLSDCAQGLTELKQTKEEISAILEEANAQGLRVQLKGNIEISVQG